MVGVGAGEQDEIAVSGFGRGGDDADGGSGDDAGIANAVDTGEAELTTGLLLARVGEGTVVYSALGWYRQLEALTPGAWRVFSNLVSLPLAP